MKHFHPDPKGNEEKTRLAHEIFNESKRCEELEHEQATDILKVTYAGLSYLDRAAIDKKIRARSQTIKKTEKLIEQLQAKHDAIKDGNNND